jgi:SNF2 family DNA or RNA helicase
MQVVQERAVVLRVKDSARAQSIVERIKKSRILSDGTVAVYWSLENAELLTNMGFYSVTAPLSRDYAWSGADEPFEHQKHTASFLAANHRAFCFNEAGTGKTKAVLWAMDYLMQQGKIRRTLVVCPMSIMREAWASEAFATTMHRHALVCHGSREERKKILEQDSDLVIINYDGVPLLEKELRNKFDLIVIDEANYLKNVKTNRWKAVHALINANTRVWLLTGTPAAQSPLDAYGLAKLIVPHRVPAYQTRWRDMVLTQVSQFRWVSKVTATQTVSYALRPAIRYTKKDCLDLPEVTYQTRYIEMTAQQKQFYTKLKKQMLVEAGGEIIRAAHAAAGINKLLQLSVGCVYSDTGEVVDFDGSHRIKELIHIVSEAAHKVIVFVPFRHALESVANELKKQGFSVEKIFGGVSMTERTRIFKTFQTEDDPRVLVVQPQSASHGVTLTRADTIVWFGPIASVETWLQANERINRPSQKNKMTIIKLYGSDVEKRVYSVLESKHSAQTQLVELYKNLLGD